MKTKVCQMKYFGAHRYINTLLKPYWRGECTPGLQKSWTNNLDKRHGYLTYFATKLCYVDGYVQSSVLIIYFIYIQTLFSHLNLQPKMISYAYLQQIEVTSRFTCRYFAVSGGLPGS